MPRPGQVRDAIISYLKDRGNAGASLGDIRRSVNAQLGEEIAQSSVRSYLNINTGPLFERVARGHYRLIGERK